MITHQPSYSKYAIVVSSRSLWPEIQSRLSNESRHEIFKNGDEIYRLYIILMDLFIADKLALVSRYGRAGVGQLLNHLKIAVGILYCRSSRLLILISSKPDLRPTDSSLIIYAHSLTSEPFHPPSLSAGPTIASKTMSHYAT